MKLSSFRRSRNDELGMSSMSSVALILLGMVACAGPAATPTPTNHVPTTPPADAGPADSADAAFGTEAPLPAPSTDVAAEVAPDVAPDVADDAAAPDATPPAPALSIPGLALWLDADVGVEPRAGFITRWIDRSAQHHVFVTQGPGGTIGSPVAAQLGGHAALGFDGKTRMVADPLDLAEQAPLTIGTQDFLLAVVVSAVQRDVDQVVSFGLMPRITGGDIRLPTGTTFYLALNRTLDLSFGGHGEVSNFFSVETGGPFADHRPHLVVVHSATPALGIRIDGRRVLDDPNGRRAGRRASGAVVPLPYAPVFLGNWDFDFHGLDGELAEVVLVIGPGASSALPDLEAHLRGKYGL
jgi:hypothetical protein